MTGSQSCEVFLFFCFFSVYLLDCRLFQFLRVTPHACNYVFIPPPSHDSQRYHTRSSRQVKTSFRHFITMLLELFVTVSEKPLLVYFILKTDFVKGDL